MPTSHPTHRDLEIATPAATPPRAVTLEKPAIGGFAERFGKAKRIVGADRRARLDNIAKGTGEWRSLCHLMGAAIRKARCDRDVSAAELAAALHTRATVIARWEAGKQPPSVAALLAISLALDCPIGELVPVDVRNVHILTRSRAALEDQAQQDAIAAIKRSGGNLSAAGRDLGVHKNTVRLRLHKAGLAHLIRPYHRTRRKPEAP